MRRDAAVGGCICVSLYMLKGTNLRASALLCEGEWVYALQVRNGREMTSYISSL